MNVASKRYREKYRERPSEPLSLEAAVEWICARASAKFDETVEIAVNLGIDTRQSDQTVRGLASLPHGTGKKVRVAVFARGEKAASAQQAGADLVGAEDLAEKIEGGEIMFDRVIADPSLMSIVSRLGRILGPRGLMPNPRMGTVTPDVASAVRAVKKGRVSFRADKGGIVHAAVGKASFPKASLLENIHAMMSAVLQARPSEAKGVYLRSAFLSTTMGAGIAVDVAEFSLRKEKES